MTCRCVHGCLWYADCLSCAEDRELAAFRHRQQVERRLLITSLDPYGGTNPRQSAIWTNIGSFV